VILALLLTTVWVMRVEVCGPPDPTRNVCHGNQVISYYASKAECEADIPAMRKRRFKDFYIQDAGDCEAVELEPDIAERVLPHEYKLHILTNGLLHQANESFTTREACKWAGYFLASRGKIRSYTCLQSR
jgi:hypothetical protein